MITGASRGIGRAIAERLAAAGARLLITARSDAALQITLSATTGFVVLILGFAFHWQSTRAREGDLINDAVRSRIDTALNRGRCGLWDWDLSRGRIFWSQSMFTMLGLDSRSDLLTFGEVNALVNSDDIDLFNFADQLIAGARRASPAAARLLPSQTPPVSRVPSVSPSCAPVPATKSCSARWRAIRAPRRSS